MRFRGKSCELRQDTWFIGWFIPMSCLFLIMEVVNLCSTKIISKNVLLMSEMERRSRRSGIKLTKLMLNIIFRVAYVLEYFGKCEKQLNFQWIQEKRLSYISNFNVEVHICIVSWKISPNSERSHCDMQIRYNKLIT